ncbi:bifunctional molybdenum cofactor biosynthesis protein MoaC/MoaB [Pedobacter sp. B4-66]|uniref:bifunctional molybdenum cofactor biosynthesis protein MoaC/MoaB n=1 Tax=Pedobacter sp. B4-66 TaxID=2817280 RepID=UPI001BDB5CB4|nr:bifunctional molybdenum cofactor biosynthesis protein MoaC/MoaB [Pedobacter sp. B4-66]
MRDITGKQITLRTAKAVANIFCSTETISKIKGNELPKGNLFDVARAAGFLGAKLTPQLLPHCHPVNIDSMDISFSFLPEGGIQILGEAKSIGRTGIEMEILTAVSIAALEIYDMLKPVDTDLEIGNIKLLQKTGGKSDRKKYFSTSPTCAVLVCSDSTAAGKREDKSGLAIKSILEQAKAKVVAYEIVADDKAQIQKQLLQWVSEDIHFIFTTGGTGLGPRDNTVSAVSEILERDADGITEAMRNFGQMRTPMAMMSRAVAGSIAHSLIVTLPGSTDGARESLEAIVPGVFHARKMMKGGGH